MYYSSGTYEAFAHPEKPEGVEKKSGFFDKDGIMQTGWVDDNDKRYYMDLDGIMQTGTITVDDQNYELQADGSLKK